MKPDSFSRAGSGWRMLPVAMTVGMIPCPGVVMVMLFTMSMNLIGLGIMLSLSIAAGMALTISIVVILVMYGKGVTLKAFGRDIRLARNLELGIKAMAGVLVAGLGGFLLIGTVYT